LSRCRARLAHLEILKQGWLAGGGNAIGAAALAGANILLSKRPAFSKVFSIYPTEEGGVLFEFETAGWDLAVEFSATGEVELYGVQVDGDEEIAPRRFADVTPQFLEELDRYVPGEGVNDRAADR
jgi:hypothetical protein